jgi:N-methylhydantoinase A/oxoprolinase/acetone carboxylase beta subunit
MWEGRLDSYHVDDGALIPDSTTTDICALLKTGFPRQSAAFVKIAGVRTNFSIPDVYSIPLGGGSIVRTAHQQVHIGPDSVGSRLAEEGICFGGQTFTVSGSKFRVLRK